MSNLKSVTLAVLELLAFSGQKFRGSRDHGHAHFRASQKYFLRAVKGKLCSKFGDDRSKSGLTMLAVVAGWTDTGRTDGHRTDRMDTGRMDGHRADAFFLSNAVHCIGQTKIQKARAACRAALYTFGAEQRPVDLRV